MAVAEPLLLVGAGPLTGEVLAAVAALNAEDRGSRSSGSSTTMIGAWVGAVRHAILGPVDAAASYPAARVVVCTGSPRNWWSRSMLVDRLATSPPGMPRSSTRPPPSLRTR